MYTSSELGGWRVISESLCKFVFGAVHLWGVHVRSDAVELLTRSVCVAGSVEDEEGTEEGETISSKTSIDSVVELEREACLTNRRAVAVAIN